MRQITDETITKFKLYLESEEKSKSTVEKYVRDVTMFAVWLNGRDIQKSIVIEYKHELIENYALASVNAALSSINCFFAYNEWFDCKVKTIKIQRQIYASHEKELSKAEYERLLDAAKKKSERLFYLMQTICSTGIRVSELKFITVEAVKNGEADINCKGKRRKVWLPKALCIILKKYIKKSNIKRGSVFVTKNGKPLDRSNIWAEMKKLCEKAGVLKEKVFPHNLRHLFARVYYAVQKDIVRLADILGHSSVNTTRIYTMECGDIHRQQIQKLGLLRC